MENRKSLRLKEYDYSQPGYYYVTLCTYNKECLFGYIADEVMVLNSKGKMVETYWLKLLDKFPDVELVEFIVMPNHIHGIIQLIAPNSIIGSDLRVYPADKQIQCEYTGSSLYQIIQWFKTMTTNVYIKQVKQGRWQAFDKRIWQRSYYEHVIRNDEELIKIREYIQNNPLKWSEDKYFTP